MIVQRIPGFGELRLEHLVLDFNGTLALDGNLLPGVGALLGRLSAELELHVVTADTHGGCAEALAGLPVRLGVLGGASGSLPEDEAKLALLRSLGAERSAAVGNGRNDTLMLEHAALGVAVLGPECAAPACLAAADIVAPDIDAALGLLLRPARIAACLRK